MKEYLRLQQSNIYLCQLKTLQLAALKTSVLQKLTMLLIKFAVLLLLVCNRFKVHRNKRYTETVFCVQLWATVFFRAFLEQETIRILAWFWVGAAAQWAYGGRFLSTLWVCEIFFNIFLATSITKARKWETIIPHVIFFLAMK